MLLPADAQRPARIAVAMAAAAMFTVIAGFRYLPLTDFPQHALQLSAWVHAHDPAFAFDQQYELNWRTPYLLSYLLARPLVPLVGVAGSLKVVLAAGVAATVFAFARLARALGLDPWWTLPTAPLALGFAFAFGFINFVLATPLVLAAMADCLAVCSGGGRPSRARLALFLVLLVPTHGFALVVAFLLCAPMPAISAIRSRDPARCWPLLGPVLAVLPWLPGYLRSSNGFTEVHVDIWGLGAERLLELPGLVAGGGRADWLGALYAITIAVALVALAGRPSRAPLRWLPLATVVAAYLLCPFKLRGVAFLYQRFAAFMIPALLVAIEPAERGRASLRRLVQVAFPSVWLGFLALRFASFQIEAQGWVDVEACMRPGKRVRPLMFLRDSESMPGAAPFLHFPAYYTAEKGGWLGFSFAANYTSFARYRPGVRFGMKPDQEWAPWTFEAKREVPEYDYFVARSDRDLGPALFRTSPVPIRLACSSGRWFVYERADRGQ